MSESQDGGSQTGSYNICCKTVLTIEHLLLHCNNYTSIRNKYYDTTTLSELFSKVSPHKILEFLKECDLYHKI